MADKTRKTPNEIKDSILLQLKSGPKTIAEIGEVIGSNWLTTEKFLKELIDLKLIIEVFSSPKMKVYRRTDDIAFYGLPFSEDIRKNSASLLFTIAEKWKKETGVIPSRTILQKIAVELVEGSEEKTVKKIPVMRFHYGKTLAVGYEETAREDYCDSFSLINSDNQRLLKIINEYRKLSSRDVQKKQYAKEGMEFYREKEEKVLNSFSKSDDFKEIEKSLLKWSVYYPNELGDLFEIFNKFIYSSIIFLNLENNGERKEYLNKIMANFHLLWDVMTTSLFLYDSEKHIALDRKELFNQIKTSILNSKISTVTSVVDDMESEANSIDPSKIIIDNSEKSKEFLHDLMEE